MMFARSIRVAGLSAALILIACGDNGLEPSAVAGFYTATTLRGTTGGQVTDVLADGGSLNIALNNNGSTTGQVFVPEGSEDGSDLVANLAGTWSLSGNTVTFQQAADTFLPDMNFTADGTTLVADQMFGGTRIEVRLTKGPVPALRN